MKKVVVTGAGSGIGKEFTKLYLEDGSHVLAVSLVQAELDQLSEDFRFGAPRLQTLQMDLSKPDAAAALLQWCQENDWFPDTLINNAGFACFGDAVDLAPERVANMLELNVITLTMTSMLFGGQMKERGHGAILNVGSTAGMVPSVRFASYGASKSYVNTFTYALAAELKPYGVTVTCLTPGATQTKFAQAGGIDDVRRKVDAAQHVRRRTRRVAGRGRPGRIRRAGSRQDGRRWSAREQNSPPCCRAPCRRSTCPS